MSVNPIWPGFTWGQEFEIDPAVTPAGSHLRIALHPGGQTPAAPIAITLTSPAAGRHLLSMTAEQTQTLRPGTDVNGDFVLVGAGGSETPLNLRLTVPVVACLTEPA